MNTKLALEILFWKPMSRPHTSFDLSVLRHFHQKIWPGKRTPAYIGPGAPREKLGWVDKRNELHSKIHDLALTHIADKLDKIAA
jgi:hypothetical protein